MLLLAAVVIGGLWTHEKGMRWCGAHVSAAEPVLSLSGGIEIKDCRRRIKLEEECKWEHCGAAGNTAECALGGQRVDTDIDGGPIERL
eukprot:scaffold149209_cov46-Prasinocladus_malaysianus.AAC.1